MKNAMKKIMSLLLVAVLMVSAIPFQAKAAENAGFNNVIFKYFDAKMENPFEESQGAWLEYDSENNVTGPKTKTPQNFMDKYGVKPGYRFAEAVTEVGGNYTTYGLNDTITAADGMTVYIKMQKIPSAWMNITYKSLNTQKEVGKKSFEMKKGDTLTFTQINNANPDTSAYTLVNYVVNGQNYTGDFVIDVDYSLEITAWLKGGSAGGSEGGDTNADADVLTASYYVNDVFQETKKYDYNGKTIAELMEYGGYTNHDLASAKRGNDTLGLKDVVKRGEAVTIKMTTKKADNSMLTATYYVNSVLQETKQYDVKGKTVAELMEMGGYTNHDLTSATRGNSSLGLKDVVNRGETVTIKMTTKKADSNVLTVSYYVNDVFQKTVKYDYNGKTIEELMEYGGYTNHTLTSATLTSKVSRSSGSLGLKDVVNRGESVTIKMTTSSTTSTDNLGSVEGNTLHMYYDPSNTNKDPYPVKLLVYVKNFGINWSNPYRTYTITDSLAKDSLVTMDEVEEFVNARFTAKTSGGIGYDGLYVRTKNIAGKYALDQGKYDRIDNLNEARKDNEIQLYVVIDNVKGVVSTSTNNSDNPKTGDTIFMTVTALGLSATALAGLYFFNKKKLVK